jgi:serine/threonine protein kinase
MICTEKMNDRTGQQLGNYQILQLLGRGGFAEVYLGEHIYLATRAALKVLAAPLDEREAAAFQREARLLAGLIHPHIVRVLEFGIENAIPYLVLDYAPGGTLRRRHPRGEQLPLTTVVEYVTQIASALQYAHGRRLIHRDVKPENILLGRDGELLLADFGIAVLTQSMRSAHTQQIVGTPTYMAPEQLQGHPCKASDQYALGILSYEWLCGRPPFSGPSQAIAAQHCFVSPPSLREKIPSLAPQVERIVLQALAKDPALRFPSVYAFAEALAASLVASASTKRSVSVPGWSSHTSPLPDQPVLSRTQPARPGVAAPASVRDGNTPDPRLLLAATVPDKRQMGTSSPLFNGASVTRPASSRSVFWALVCGVVVGYFSCGFLLLLYLQAAHGFANVLAFFIGGAAVLLSLCCLALAGRVAREFTGRLTGGWMAGSIAGLIQQISAGILGQVAPHLAFPVSFPLLLLLWGVLGGALGLLGAWRKRR